MHFDPRIEKEGTIELMSLYLPIRGQIVARLEEFGILWEKGSDEDLFRELVFCLLTPQSRAKICWKAVQRLERKCMLNGTEPDSVQEELTGVRFSQKKSEYICLASKMFSNNSLRSTLSSFSTSSVAREWLVLNIKGLGYKEASHFLRNVGLGKELAILDRHILKNLCLFGVIEIVPSSLNKKTYMKIEQKTKEFANRINIPMAHLDLLLWYKEAGEVFK
ncbi:MAG: N-glycosylase/DNA lyase [Methanotrichaceae archaeon]|nr:N-glycosylase/DNA lyase [Methanotrichaceae archaeon]